MRLEFIPDSRTFGEPRKSGPRCGSSLRAWGTQRPEGGGQELSLLDIQDGKPLFDGNGLEGREHLCHQCRRATDYSPARRRASRISSSDSRWPDVRRSSRNGFTAAIKFLRRAISRTPTVPITLRLRASATERPNFSSIKTPYPRSPAKAIAAASPSPSSASGGKRVSREAHPPLRTARRRARKRSPGHRASRDGPEFPGTPHEEPRSFRKHG